MLDLSQMRPFQKQLFKDFLKLKIIGHTDEELEQYFRSIDDAFLAESKVTLQKWIDANKVSSDPHLMDTSIRHHENHFLAYADNFKKTLRECFYGSLEFHAKTVGIEFKFRKELSFELRIRIETDNFHPFWDAERQDYPTLKVQSLGILMVDAQYLNFMTFSHVFKVQVTKQKTAEDKWEVVWHNSDDILDRIIASFSTGGKVSLVPKEKT